jgi:Cd2+/Zn2+-exporting ATPase
MVALAAAVERRSEHPLAEAITTEAQQRGVHRRYRPAEGVTALSGRGVEGTLDGQRVRVGRHALFHEGGTACGSLHAQITEAEQSGETVVLVGRGDEVLGYLTLADTPREASQHALAELKAAYPGLHTIMLTGDNPTTALKVADAVGHIDEVRASLLPAEKLAAVRELESVAMVGDGINDAPALAAADVGIAMGGAGTAQAMETADVVLMRDDLTRLPDAIATSHKARRVIQANIAIALGLKGVVLVLTLVGAASLWLAVLADMGSSLLVTVNGLRLLRGGGPTPEVQSA